MKLEDFIYSLVARTVVGFVVFIAVLSLFSILAAGSTVPDAVWASAAVLLLLAIVFIDIVGERLTSLSKLVEDICRATVNYCKQKYADFRHKRNK